MKKSNDIVQLIEKYKKKKKKSHWQKEPRTIGKQYNIIYWFT